MHLQSVSYPIKNGIHTQEEEPCPNGACSRNGRELTSIVKKRFAHLQVDTSGKCQPTGLVDTVSHSPLTVVKLDLMEKESPEMPMLLVEETAFSNRKQIVCGAGGCLLAITLVNCIAGRIFHHFCHCENSTDPIEINSLNAWLSSFFSVGTILPLTFFFLKKREAQIHASYRTTVADYRQKKRKKVEKLQEFLVDYNKTRKSASKHKDNTLHELRNFIYPLSSNIDRAYMRIKKMVETKITQQMLSTELKLLSRDIQTIEKSKKYLLLVISNTLDIKKMQSNQVKPKLAPCSLYYIAKDIMELVDEKVSAHTSVQFSSQFDDEHVLFLSDAFRISQVVVNLLNNALKYTQEGKIALRAHIERKAFPESTLCISISDTGCGIPSGKQELLFQEYSQLNVADAQTGTGLGLYLCKVIIEWLGGEINCKSELGEGSQFYFSIPITLLKRKRVPSKSKENFSIT